MRVEQRRASYYHLSSLYRTDSEGGAKMCILLSSLYRTDSEGGAKTRGRGVGRGGQKMT